MQGYLPVVETTCTTDLGTLGQKALATTVGDRQRVIVLQRLTVSAGVAPCEGWLCLALLPWGPSSFQRHDRAGRYLPDPQLSYVRYRQDDSLVEVNNGWGPIFDTAPAYFGAYGNPDSDLNPEHYLADNPLSNLGQNGALNGVDVARTVSPVCAQQPLPGRTTSPRASR
jgi:hypothetical protein